MCMARDEIGNGLLFAPKRCFVVVDVLEGCRDEHVYLRCEQLFLCLRGSWSAWSTMFRSKRGLSMRCLGHGQPQRGLQSDRDRRWLVVLRSCRPVPADLRRRLCAGTTAFWSTSMTSMRSQTGFRRYCDSTTRNGGQCRHTRMLRWRRVRGNHLHCSSRRRWKMHAGGRGVARSMAYRPVESAEFG